MALQYFLKNGLLDVFVVVLVDVLLILRVLCYFFICRHSPILMCLHTVPAAIEERGPEWPEDWPQRLDNFPKWLNNREGLVQDTEHWRAIVNSSYLNGLGIDSSSVWNVMDMKAIYGG